MTIWNKCDICGKIISSKEFDEGTSIRELDTPDSEFTSEEYFTYHIKCYKKLKKEENFYAGIEE